MPSRSPSADSAAPLLARPLTAADAPAFAALCAREPIRFLTPRLNVECYGFAGPVVRCWGVFEAEEAQMRGVMLRFSNTAVVVDAAGECAAIFTALIDSEQGLMGVRGTLEAVRGVQATLRRYRPNEWEDSFFMRLRCPPLCPPETLALARRATPEDLEKLATFYTGAGTMYRSRANVAGKLADTRVFVVEEPAYSRRPARIASCALLNVEGSDAGLIGGVYTLPEARGRGYASACVSALALDLQHDGKLPCLFYENPLAGRIYQRLGFEEIGTWALLYLAPRTRGKGQG